MCGIAGFNLPTPTAPGILAAMTRSLVHRGPDGEGFYSSGGVGLGHRRLSILDIEGGRQPMENEDGSVHVVYNGEIYNYKVLRRKLEERGHRFRSRSDTEVLVHLYEEEGENLCSGLNGIFAFALYDEKRRKLLLARDPVGVKPLYYSLVDGGVIFASELKALILHPAFSREIDEEALSAYLTCEYVPAPLTIYRRARKLLPGHLLVMDGKGSPEVTRYWEWTRIETLPSKPDEASDLVREAVSRSVGSQLVSDVPLGVFLSGGVDSSIVASCMAAAGGDVESFSIGFEDPSFDESAYARAAAEHLGCNHHAHLFSERELLDEVPAVLSMMDEPFADPSIFPTALLSRFTRKEVTVALGGDGGDELFAGYPTYWVHRRFSLYKAFPKWVRTGTLKLADGVLPVSHANLTLPYKLRKFMDGAEYEMPLRHHLWMGAWTPADIERLMPGHRPNLDALEKWIPAPPAGDPVTEAQWLDFHTYLVEDILAKVDRASMMTSLEARVPLLDVNVVRLAFSIPWRWKLKGTSGKRVFKEAFANDFPAGHFDRPKKGFGIPLSRWLTGPLKPFAEELLSDDILGSCPFFRADEPRRMWKEHLAMKADHRKPLWSLLCFLEWWKRRRV